MSEQGKTTAKTEAPVAKVSPFADKEHVWRRVKADEALKDLRQYQVKDGHVWLVGPMRAKKVEGCPVQLVSVDLDMTGLTRQQEMDILAAHYWKCYQDKVRALGAGNPDKLSQAKPEHLFDAAAYEAEKATPRTQTVEQRVRTQAVKAHAAGLSIDEQIKLLLETKRLIEQGETAN